MLKIVLITLICAFIIYYLKSINSDLYQLALIGAGIIVLSQTFVYLFDTFAFFEEIINLSGVDSDFYKIIFKITAIGYLVEFGASTVKDMGFNSLAEKLIFAGKAIILYVSLPILTAVFNLLKGLV